MSMGRLPLPPIKCVSFLHVFLIFYDEITHYRSLSRYSRLGFVISTLPNRGWENRLSPCCIMRFERFFPVGIFEEKKCSFHKKNKFSLNLYFLIGYFPHHPLYIWSPNRYKIYIVDFLRHAIRLLPAIRTHFTHRIHCCKHIRCFKNGAQPIHTRVCNFASAVL